MTATAFYLELNDDALIRDIVSGVYGGAPAANDIQNLWPFGAFVSLLYRIAPGVPWFGGILFGLQLLCLMVMLLRALAIASHRKADAAVSRLRRTGLITGVVLVWTILCLLLLPHFFFVQYSVTVGFLAMTAAFLFVTGEKKRHFAFGVLFTGIAFIIRSEMLLLLLPLVLLALFFRYVREVRVSRADNEEMPGLREFLRYPFITDHYRLYGVAFFSVFLLLAAGWSMDRIGYAASDWNDFVRFFDARTEVYDFTGIPAYEGNEDFYDSIGLGRESVTLLENYNFGLDERIDTEAMEAVAKYAAGQLPPRAERLAKALNSYIYRLHHAGFPVDHTWPQTDAPWNLFLYVAYIAIAVISWHRTPEGKSTGYKAFRALWQPVLLFACRTALWLYILTRGRDPVRIMHPLCFVELSVLTGTFLMQTISARKEVVRETGEHRETDPREMFVMAVRGAAMLFVIVTGFVYLGNGFRLIGAERAKREAANAPYEALHAYCASHRDNLYFLDVYSSVRESKPLFRETAKKGRPDNLDLLGGWAVKSPVWRDKLERFGFDEAEEAMISDGVFFVADAASDVSWITDYYAAKGTAVTVTAEDRVSGGADTFVIYSVRENAP
ncbi:MAG: hypothetical protein K6G16_05685 [Lachnospiraceae bacterium]|nr:hypothetical protein [Lachnospiraceae bacterium]